MSFRYGRRPGVFPLRARRAARNFRSSAVNRYRRRPGAPRFSAASRGRVRARTYQALNQRTGGLLGIEKKFLDIQRSGLALTAPTGAEGGEINPSAGCTGCLSAPAQGDGPTNRDGNKIVVCEIGLTGAISIGAQAAQTSADTLCEVFVCLVQDMQTNGVTLNSEDVWTNPTANAILAANLFRNMSFTSRFKVLKMKVLKFQMPAIAGISASLEQAGMIKTFKMKWKGSIPVTFTTASTTADVANVTDNSIHCIAYANNLSLQPFILYNARTRFYG